MSMHSCSGASLLCLCAMMVAPFHRVVYTHLPDVLVFPVFHGFSDRQCHNNNGACIKCMLCFDSARLLYIDVVVTIIVLF